MARRKAGSTSKAASSTKKNTRARKVGARPAKKVAVRKKAAGSVRRVTKKVATKKATRKKAMPTKAAPKKVAARKPVPRPARKVKRSAPAKAGKTTRPAAKAKAPQKKAAPKAVTARKPAANRARAKARPRTSSIDSRRRELEEMVPSPPSSLNMNRRGSAARTGRDEMAEHRADHATMTPSITGGDVDANVEDAYFTGDEAPGGDNSTPDQDIVDDIGKALGVEYQDNEELRGSDKVADRDKHRWELDPASAEDYRDRDRERNRDRDRE